MLTGLRNREVDLQAMHAGAADYLVKDELSALLLERSIRYAIERKRSEERLQESQQFLQSTLDALSAHIAVLDENGVVVAVNEAWRRFAVQNDYRDPSCGIGLNYLAICDAALYESSEAKFISGGIREVLDRGRHEFELEYPCTTPQEPLWFNIRVTRFPGAGPTRVVVAHENVTERRRAEEQRRQSEQRLSGLIQNAPCHRVDDRCQWRLHVLRWWSVERTGPAAGQIVGKPLDEVFADKPEILHAHQRALAGEEVTLAVKVSEATFESRYTPMRDANNRVTGVFGVALDITDRVQAEEALRDSETRFRTVVHNLGEGLLITDLNDVVLYANPRTSQLCGYSTEEMLGWPAYELLLPPEEWPTLQERNEQRAGGHSDCYEVQMQRKGGTMFWA
jgi:PAS domain S-box-containing protein